MPYVLSSACVIFFQNIIDYIASLNNYSVPQIIPRATKKGAFPYLEEKTVFSEPRSPDLVHARTET